MIDALLERAPYTIAQAEKEALLCQRLSELTEHHRSACPAYARVLDLLWPQATRPFERVGDVPWLPVQLFKSHELSSIPAEAPDANARFDHGRAAG